MIAHALGDHHVVNSRHVWPLSLLCQLIVGAEHSLMLQVNVVHDKASNDEDRQDDHTHQMSCMFCKLGLLRFGELFEADGDSYPSGDQKDRQTVQQAFHCKVPPCDNVRVQVIGCGDLETRGSSRFQTVRVVGLRNTNIDSDDVQKENCTHQSEAQAAKPTFNGDKVQLLPHRNDVGTRGHHQTRDHTEFFESREPLIQDVVLEEARIILQVHGVRLNETKTIFHHLKSTWQG
mmetsp:Transcript_126250/g.178162  ORF Transcript_126250/g.178162 Transcript_126250/m.178162 type:complete len:233 (-) Transcript_126250:140-838(-)